MRLLPLILAVPLIFGCSCAMTAAGTEGKSTAMDKQNTTPPAASGRGVSMRVLWTASHYVITPQAQWKDEDVAKLLIKSLDITENSIRYGSDTCGNIIFNKEKVNTKEYLESVYKTTPQALGIEDETIEVIKTNCNLPGFESYLRLKHGRLAIHISGVFIFFRPALNY